MRTIDITLRDPETANLVERALAFVIDNDFFDIPDESKLRSVADAIKTARLRVEYNGGAALARPQVVR